MILFTRKPHFYRLLKTEDFAINEPIPFIWTKHLIPSRHYFEVHKTPLRPAAEPPNSSTNNSVSTYFAQRASAPGQAHHPPKLHLSQLRMSEASTSYKKQDGKLSVAKDGKTVSWKSVTSSTPPLTIAVSEITSTTLLTSTGQPE